MELRNTALPPDKRFGSHEPDLGPWVSQESMQEIVVS